MNPERHLQCANILGADVSNAKSTGDYAGNLLAEEILKLMDATGVPMGAVASLSVTLHWRLICCVPSSDVLTEVTSCWCV